MQRSKSSDQVFDKLSVSPETRDQAHFYVYILVKLNDHEGPPKALLPYYCAYIASEQLQSHDVRLDNVLELGRIKHGDFWLILERTQNLLCQAAETSLDTDNDKRWTFEYPRLPVYDPPCKRCSNKGLPYLVTRFNSTGRDERGGDCQRCLLQYFTCRREHVVHESAVQAQSNTQSLGRVEEEPEEKDDGLCLMYPLDGHEQPRRHSASPAHTDLVLPEDKDPSPSCSKRSLVEDVKPPITHIDFLDVPCKRRRIKKERSQDGPSLQHVFQAAVKNEPTEIPGAQDARHEVVQMMNIIYSTANDIVEHICKAGCDNLVLKFAVDDLADTLQKLAGDGEPGAEGLHEQLSALHDEDLSSYKEVLRYVCQRLVKDASVSVVRDVKLKHVLLPALERRLAYL